MVVGESKQMLPYHGAMVDEWIGDIPGKSVIVIWDLYVGYLPFGDDLSGGIGWNDASERMTQRTAVV